MLIEFAVRGIGPLAVHSYSWLFSLKGISSSELLFTTKILQEAMYLNSPYLDQINYKI